MTGAGRLVSVVLPTFDRCSVLPRAIDSVLHQTHREIEVVVIDDGSRDGTPELLRSRYGDDPRVRVLHQANAGVVAARNRGLAAVRGAYVAFLDSDDWWRPWKVELQLACLDAVPEAGMVWTDMEAIAPDGGVRHARFLRRMYGAYRWFPLETLFDASLPLPRAAGLDPAGARLWAGDIYGPMVVGNLVHTSTALLRRERLEQVGRFDESFGAAGEDHDFHLRTCKAGLVAFADVVSTSYQIGTADRLSRHRAHIAENHLRTLRRELEADRAVGRIRVPRAVLRASEAATHRWLGEALLDVGERRRARRHLVTSLAMRPGHPRAAALALLTFLPAPLEAAARAALGRFDRHRVRRVTGSRCRSVARR
jgi:glycosyltransferase involved in cell wall biosynthesis